MKQTYKCKYCTASYRINEHSKKDTKPGLCINCGKPCEDEGWDHKESEKFLDIQTEPVSSSEGSREEIGNILDKLPYPASKYWVRGALYRLRVWFLNQESKNITSWECHRCGTVHSSLKESCDCRPTINTNVPYDSKSDANTYTFQCMRCGSIRTANFPHSCFYRGML